MAASPIAIEDLPRLTAWGAIYQTASFAGVPIPIIDQTTLNEEFNVYPTESGDHSKPPGLDYWIVGYGSTYTRPNDLTGVEESVNYVHDTLDANVFHIVPMVMREQGKDDLTPAQRSKLGLRAIENHGGKTYVVYKARKIDRSGSVISAEVVIPPADNDPEGLEVRTPIVGDPRYLKPTPVKLTTDTIRKDGAYVNVSCPLGMTLTPWELNELIKSKQIITGSALEVTEVAVLTAYNAQKTVADGDNTITYTEAIEAQMAIVMPTRIVAAHYINEGITLNHDVGVSNPTNFMLPF